MLAARSGLVPVADIRDTLANVAAWVEAQRAREWRNLQGTTNQSVMSARREGNDWRDWQRGSDYYDEMVLVWLEADMLIREASNGTRSLDDFARAFFGVAPGSAGSGFAPLTFTFADVIAALDAVQQHDWARFLRERFDTQRTGAQALALSVPAGVRAGARSPTASRRTSRCGAASTTSVIRPASASAKTRRSARRAGAARRSRPASAPRCSCWQ